MAEKGEEKKELWKTPAVRLPTEDELKGYADSLGFSCSDDEAEGFREYMKGLVKGLQLVHDLPEPQLEVKYPRLPGNPPDPNDNPNNGWAWRCEIMGAPEGKLALKKVAIKDAVAVAGVPMSNGSHLLQGYIPEFDATVVTRILDAGGTICGKSNCENLCLSGHGMTSIQGHITNPHSSKHAAGGSSGGSAVLVATGAVDMAVGGDQGGSIRIPSSWCGIVGLKPTYGLVPYTGAATIATNVDHLGPMARNVRDCALFLEVLAGYDGGKDGRQGRGVPEVKDVPEYSKRLDSVDPKTVKIALLKEGFACSDDNVSKVVKAAAEKMEKAGVTFEEVSLPQHTDALMIWFGSLIELILDNMMNANGHGIGPLGYSCTSLNDAVAKGYRYHANDLPPTVKYMSLVAKHLKKNYAGHFTCKSQNLVTPLIAAYDNVLKDFDVIMMPTIPKPAYEFVPEGLKLNDFLANAIGHIVDNTAPFDSTGHPAITVPAGKMEVEDGANLPVGAMFVGRHFEDAKVLAVGRILEKAMGGYKWVY